MKNTRIGKSTPDLRTKIKVIISIEIPSSYQLDIYHQEKLSILPNHPYIMDAL
jgi:hypothetical protein